MRAPIANDRVAAPKWLPGVTGRPRGRRLFSVPYAGAGAGAFRDWAADLRPEVELCPVQLPGRETRISEEPYREMGPLVEALYSGLRRHLAVPYAVFGHSMGALVAFELVRCVRRAGGPAPACLFVSGCRAPHLPDDEPPSAHLDDAALIEHLRSLNGTPEEVLMDDGLCSLVLPLVRADLSLCEAYAYRAEEPLQSPIVAYWGSDDGRVPREDVEGWAEQTTGEFRLRVLPGDHFFVNSARPALVADLREQCVVRMARPAGSR